MKDKAILLVHESARNAWSGKSLMSLRREMEYFHIIPLIMYNGIISFHLIFAKKWDEIDLILKSDFNGLVPMKDAYNRIGPIRDLKWYGISALRHEFDLSRLK